MTVMHTRHRTLRQVSHTSWRAYQSRILKIQSAFAAHSIDALLVSRPGAVRYLTGFTGSNGLLIVRRRSVEFFTDGRYREQARQEVGRWVGTHVEAGSLLEAAVRGGVLRKCRALGFDDAETSYRRYRELRRLLRGCALRPVSGLVEDAAVIKGTGEIDALARAAGISDRVFKEVLALIRPGVRERDIAAEITYRHMQRGAERDSFEPIVASGPRSAMPHARAGIRKVRRGDAVVLDFGCVVAGYGSDITRTVFLGRPPRNMVRAYNTVRGAQQAALAMVRDGVPAKAVDAAARGWIAERGFGAWFPHSLGHGIGLEVHERPRIAPASTEVLRSGNVITIEPGVYIPGIGGVRIEDDVVVTDHGYELLTHSPRELMQL